MTSLHSTDTSSEQDSNGFQGRISVRYGCLFISDSLHWAFELLANQNSSTVVVGCCVGSYTAYRSKTVEQKRLSNSIKSRIKLSSMAPGTGMSCTPGVLKFAMVLLGLVLGVYIMGPPLYWQVMEDIALVKRGACAPCECDCPSEALASFSVIPPGLSNLSLADCGKQNPEIRQEIERNLTDLLSEELRLHKSVAEEQQQRAEMTLRSANRLASQYQKEAEKCNAGMETCEAASERTQASIVRERKMSALWEKRARQMGWNN